MTLMTPREYFHSIDAVYINLDKAKDRRASIEKQFSSLFKSLTRRVPVHFDDMKAVGIDAKRRLIDTYLHFDNKHYFKSAHMYKPMSLSTFANRKPRKYWLSMVWLPEHYAAQESLSQTVISILKDFLDSNKENLIIMEDDAVARDFLDLKIDVPDDADILVWGGAAMSCQTDANIFAKKDDFFFKRLTGKHSAWYTTAYSFNRTGAQALYNAYASRPAVTIDTAWRYAFDNCNAYRLVPMGFVQNRDSYISDSSMKMPVTKEEAKSYNIEAVWKKKRREELANKKALAK